METTNSYKTVSPEEFSKVIDTDGINVLDVRDADSYKTSHIKGAKNIDVTLPDFVKLAEKELPKDMPIAVYCRTGKRSAMASDLLSKAGYNVTNLDGGITAWQEAGLPVVN